jgi:hypothetical protein
MLCNHLAVLYPNGCCNINGKMVPEGDIEGSQLCYQNQVYKLVNSPSFDDLTVRNNFHLFIQCNLDLVTPNVVKTSDLVTILPRPFFNLLHKII